MSPEALMALVRQHWAGVWAALTDEKRTELAARVAALAEARGDGEATRKAFHGVKLTLMSLPLDHPVRKELNGLRAVAADPRPTAELAAELLAWLAETDAASAFAASVPGPGGAEGRADGGADDRADDRHGADPPGAAPDTAGIIAAVQRRLLAAPSLGRADLDARGLDAATLDGSGLIIRLVDRAGEHRYPAFQFADATTGSGGGSGTGTAADRGLLPVVARINRLLLAEEDPWGAADWWLAGNSWLGGTPAALLGLVSDELLTAAALSVVEGD
ncbi:hypothetical protein [Kitasatospora sp. NPDC056184]|uniref:hypothetical protein n=1 Tax=Kitasatospora sp. NPDC056184 TaxID=3345738 RepID=UPI0035D6F9BE